MADVERIKQIVRNMNPSRLSVTPDGSIVITDEEAVKALRQLPADDVRTEDDSTNYLCVPINTYSCN